VQFAIVDQNPTLLNVTLQREIKVPLQATDLPAKINAKIPKESTKKGSAKQPQTVSASDEEPEDGLDDKV